VLVMQKFIFAIISNIVLYLVWHLAWESILSSGSVSKGAAATQDAWFIPKY
jgi:hypothetical protein